MEHSIAPKARTVLYPDILCDDDQNCQLHKCKKPDCEHLSKLYIKNLGSHENMNMNQNYIYVSEFCDNHACVRTYCGEMRYKNQFLCRDHI